VISNHEKELHKSGVVTLKRPSDSLEIPPAEEFLVEGDLKLTVYVVNGSVRATLSGSLCRTPKSGLHSKKYLLDTGEDSAHLVQHLFHQRGRAHASRERS